MRSLKLDTQTEAPPKTTPKVDTPDKVDPDRRLNPDRLCPTQKDDVVRRIKNV